MMQTKVISIGGSIIAPDLPDQEFLVQFTHVVVSWLVSHPNRSIVLVAGGGAVARTYQGAYRTIEAKLGPTQRFNTEKARDTAADWIGVMATRLNAELLRACFGPMVHEPVVTNPMEAPTSFNRILIGSGWKPGFSSDYDAVLLATKYGANTVINLSNIAQVYTADPKKDESAQPIVSISWADFRKMVGNEWTPGMNTPFDPIASQLAEEKGIKVICAAGKNLENLAHILNDEDFLGTTIG